MTTHATGCNTMNVGWWWIVWITTYAKYSLVWFFPQRRAYNWFLDQCDHDMWQEKLKVRFEFAHSYLWCTSIGLSKRTSNVVAPATQIKFCVLFRHNLVPMWSWVRVSLNPFLVLTWSPTFPCYWLDLGKFWVRVRHLLGPTWQNYYLSKLTLHQEDDSEMRCAWQQGGTHEKVNIT